MLNSELVLPSGMGLSLGAMIHVMRRRKVMDGIFEVQGGGGRQRRERKGGSKEQQATRRDVQEKGLHDEIEYIIDTVCMEVS